jgi:hypothetical protein
MTSKRNKFVVAELFSNSDGKTSASGFIGILVGVTGCLAFITAIVGYIFEIPDTINVMQQSTIFIGAASALLAARKFAPGANTPETPADESTNTLTVTSTSSSTTNSADPVI